MRVLAAVLIAVALAAPAARPATSGGGEIEAAFSRFCSVAPDKRPAVVASLLHAGVEFDVAFSRLQRGCAPAGAPRGGRRLLSRRNRDGQRHPYLVLGPESPQADRRYAVRFYLHGGVNRRSFEPGESWWRDPDRLTGDWITVLPASWKESPWWKSSQVENLAGILDRLKREYNIDENRVYLTGISDGGSGVYYQAMRNPTPWAAFLPFIGSASVAASARIADGEFHLANLISRPFYIVNGEIDRLYPARTIAPFVNRLREIGAEVVFRALEGVGHEMGWWPAEAPAIELFLDQHARDPLPDRLDWQIGEHGRFDRIHWLVVDETARAGGARIAVERRDNMVLVRSAGVLRFTLLISAAQFDLTRPLLVVVNDRLVYEQSVEPSVESLLTWAARDLDRTMLFAAEIGIEIPQPL